MKARRRRRAFLLEGVPLLRNLGGMSEPLATHALHALHAELGARIVPFAGWEMPVQYAGIIEEHRGRPQGRRPVRRLAHGRKPASRGRDAAAFLDRIMTNDMASIRPGMARYTVMPCQPDGGCVDDPIVYRFSGDGVPDLPQRLERRQGHRLDALGPIRPFKVEVPRRVRRLGAAQRSKARWPNASSVSPPRSRSGRSNASASPWARSPARPAAWCPAPATHRLGRLRDLTSPAASKPRKSRGPARAGQAARARARRPRRPRPDSASRRTTRSTATRSPSASRRSGPVSAGP
jgi:hypothetical protein